MSDFIEDGAGHDGLVESAEERRERKRACGLAALYRPELIKRMGDAEDQCRSVSVGGAMVDADEFTAQAQADAKTIANLKAELRDVFKDNRFLRETIASITLALEESVKLQSHYAELLNMYDGGKRIGFVSAAVWIERLKECGKL